MLQQEKVGVLMWHNCIYTGITIEGSNQSCTWMLHFWRCTCEL